MTCTTSLDDPFGDGRYSPRGTGIPTDEAAYRAFRQVTGWARDIWTLGHEFRWFRYIQPRVYTQELCALRLREYQRLDYGAILRGEKPFPKGLHLSAYADR